MFIDIKPGKQFVWKGRLVEIDGQVSMSSVEARDTATGELVTVATSELELPSKPAVASRRLNTISTLDWERASLLRTLLMPHVESSRVPKRVFEEISLKTELSIRHIRRLLDRLRVAPLTSALVPRRAGRKRYGWSIDPAVEHVISHCIQKYYLVRERCTVADLAQRVQKLCRRAHLNPPSVGVVTRRVETLDSVLSLSKRRGTKAANQEHEPRVGRLVTTQALQVVQMDHTRVDVHVVTDDGFREWLGRPFLTLAIDTHTRCILGFYLTMDQPSSLSVAMCISHAILPKGPWLDSLGLDVDWPMFGRPEKLFTDNAMEFRGTAAARGCEELGIILEHRPVGSPHWGGHIERLIGTVMGHMHFLPGTTFSSIRDKEDYESQKRACMTLRELQEWLIYEICCNYHVTKHRSLQVSPAKMWEMAFPGASQPQEVIQ